MGRFSEDLLLDPMLRISEDRSQRIDSLINTMWNVTGPSDVYLLDFLSFLAAQDTDLGFTHYERIAPKVRSPDEVVIEEGRHGKFWAVLSSLGTHSFNLLITDENVIRENRTGKKRGDFRKFSVVSHDGLFYAGMGDLIVKNDDEEVKSFLEEREIEDSLEFQLFERPEIDFIRYAQLLALCHRIRLESEAYGQLEEKLEKQGVRVPRASVPVDPFVEGTRFFRRGGKKEGKTESRIVWNLESRLDFPESGGGYRHKGRYPRVGLDENGDKITYRDRSRLPVFLGKLDAKQRQGLLRYAKLRKNLQLKRRPQMLQTQLRAMDLAIKRYGLDGRRIRPEEAVRVELVPDKAYLQLGLNKATARVIPAAYDGPRPATKRLYIR